MKKKLLVKEEFYIQFSDEEVDQLGLKKDWPYSIEEHEDGGLVLKPHVGVEIELSDFERPLLEHLIAQSCEKDVSVNEVISDILKEMIEEYDV